MLDKKAIIEANDIGTGKISVPEWGGDVCVKSISIRERDMLGSFARKFLETDIDKKGKLEQKMLRTEEAEKAFNDFRLYKVGFSLCDDKGERIFNDEEIETILCKKSPESIDRVFNEIEKALEKKN